MRVTSRFLVAVVLFVCTLTAWAENAVLKKPPVKPGRISEKLYVIGQEVIRDQWRDTLGLVNVPDVRKTAFPGQCVSIAVLATGDKRAALLRASSYDFTIRFNGKTRIYRKLHTAQIKRIKPEGGDFVMQVLGAADVKIPADSGIAPDLSMASLATFDVGWCVPQDARDGKAVIRGTATLPKGEVVKFTRVRLPVLSFETGVKRGAFKDEAELGRWIMGYYRHPNPARVLPACRLLVNSKLAFTLNMRAFLAALLKSSPAAARDLQRRFSGETPPVRGYALHLLEKAGYDTEKLIAQLPEKERAYQIKFLERVPPFPDIYDLHVDASHFDTPKRMDALWSSFLATGNPKPVRAVADLLMWRDDYKAVVEAQKSANRPKTLTAEMGRGVCYMAAGWSLGSFVRNHGLVADFVDAWKKDPGTPKILREELETLLVNEAFKKHN